MRQQVTVATGFANPASLAVDAAGNVYVADKGAGAVYKLTPATSGAYAQTTLLSSVVPDGVATDAAGDVYVQDQSSGSVIEVPVSGTETSVLTGLQNPAGIAVDGSGNVFSADAKNYQHHSGNSQRRFVRFNNHASHKHCGHVDERWKPCGHGHKPICAQRIHARRDRMHHRE